MPSRERRLKENAKKVAKENKSLTSYFSTSQVDIKNELFPFVILETNQN